MNDHTEVLPAPLQEDAFDIVMRGYSRGQVDEYVRRTKRQLEELESRLARAEREAEDARRERDAARNDASTTQRKLEGQEPSYEDLGERLTQILNLAHEEAEERRERIVAEAEQWRTQAREEAEGVHDEVERQRAAAASEAERVRSEAHEEAERVRTEAEESAEQLRAEAEQRAEQLVSEAEGRSRDVEESARQRVEDLERQHADLVERLASVRDSLQVLLPQQVVDPELGAPRVPDVETAAAEDAGEAGTAGDPVHLPDSSRDESSGPDVRQEADQGERAGQPTPGWDREATPDASDGGAWQEPDGWSEGEVTRVVWTDGAGASAQEDETRSPDGETPGPHETSDSSGETPEPWNR